MGCAQEATALSWPESQDALILIRLSNQAESVELTIRELRRRDSRARIVVIDCVFDPDQVAAVFRAAADGGSDAADSRDARVGALKLVVLGQKVLSTKRLSGLLEPVALTRPARETSPPQIADLPARRDVCPFG